MRYLFLLLLVGCGGGSIEEVQAAPEPVEEPVDYLPNTVFNTSMNGVIGFIQEDSWQFNSHTKPECDGVETTKCRKINAVWFEDRVAYGDITKYSFDLRVGQYDLMNAPEWMIVFQDWVRIVPTDSNGNHPITTLKLKVEDNKLYLAHYRNSWQFGYDWGANRDGDILDIDHTKHAPNRLVGRKELDLDSFYKVDFIIYDYGRASLFVNGERVTNMFYQTKSPTEKHIQSWGMYWSKGYDSTPMTIDIYNLSITKL